MKIWRDRKSRLKSGEIGSEEEKFGETGSGDENLERGSEEEKPGETESEEKTWKDRKWG